MFGNRILLYCKTLFSILSEYLYYNRSIMRYLLVVIWMVSLLLSGCVYRQQKNETLLTGELIQPTPPVISEMSSEDKITYDKLIDAMMQYTGIQWNYLPKKTETPLSWQIWTWDDFFTVVDKNWQVTYTDHRHFAYIGQMGIQSVDIGIWYASWSLYIDYYEDNLKNWYPTILKFPVDEKTFVSYHKQIDDDIWDYRMVYNPRSHYKICKQILIDTPADDNYPYNIRCIWYDKNYIYGWKEKRDENGWYELVRMKK